MVPQRENLIAALLAGAAALAGSLLWAQIAAAQAICSKSLIGGPLLSDQQAAQGIGNTQPVSTDAANAAANSYFANNGASASYASQLALYHNTAPSWGGVTARIDGACPLGPHPDTAAVINWAANKWGISPQLMFAEASVESHWRQSAVGDSGGSVGLFQVANNPADRPGGQYHAFPGLLHSPLPSESSCFNADFYAGRLYAVYHGLAGATTPAGNLTDAVQAWYQHNAMVPGDYSNRVCSL